MARFFLDENLSSRLFSVILLDAGIEHRTSKEWGLIGAPDHIWIPQVTAAGYVIVTGDKRFRHRKVEKDALIRSNACVITVGMSRGATLEMNAHTFVNSQSAIYRLIKRETPPWLIHMSVPNPKDYALSRSGRLGKNKLTR